MSPKAEKLRKSRREQSHQGWPFALCIPVMNCFTTLTKICLVLHDIINGIWKCGVIIYGIIFGKILQVCGRGPLLLSIHTGEPKGYKHPMSEKMSDVVVKAWERSSYIECCGSVGKVSSTEQRYFNMQTHILWNKDNMGHIWCETISQKEGHCRRSHHSRTGVPGAGEYWNMGLEVTLPARKLHPV